MFAFHPPNMTKRAFLHLIFDTTWVLDTAKDSPQTLMTIADFVTAASNRLPLSDLQWKSVLQLAFHLEEITDPLSHDEASARLWLQQKALVLNATISNPGEAAFRSATIGFLSIWRDLLNREPIRQ